MIIIIDGTVYYWKKQDGFCNICTKNDICEENLLFNKN